MSESGAALPLSHPVRVETIKPRGTRIVLKPGEAELAALARALDLPSVEALEASYELLRNGERVKLEGKIAARLHQTCIVTLDAFPVSLTVPVKLDFRPGSEVLAAEQRDSKVSETGEIDVEVLLNEEDPPEPIIDGSIDLGAITAEFLALALDPYPRKPGATFDTQPEDAVVDSPFAALAKLKRGE